MPVPLVTRSFVFAVTIIFAVFAPLVSNAQATAPPGYHYDVGGMTPVPDDPCWHPSLVSSGAVEHVNRTIGKPQGIPQRIISINDLAEANHNAVATIGISLVGYSGEQGGLACHVTLNFSDGSAKTGILSFLDPGEYAGVQIQWIPDTIIVKDLVAYDQLSKSKHLYVVPDLTTPSIQMCVARAWVLGAEEQFAGQLWAACAQRNGSDLLPPASKEKHWPTQ